MSEQQAERLVEALEAWWREQPLAELIPQDELAALLDEARQDDALWERVRPRVDEVWRKAEERLRKEDRPARALMSERAAEQLLEALEQADPDPEAVRTFLLSPAIEAMLGSILYAGITEFIKRADLFGNLVNRLPVIGPIRKKVMAIVSEEVEVRLEAKIKSFLGGFSGKAVERMIQFVLSEENRPGFRAARRRLGEHLLDRSVSSLLPAPEATARWRERAVDEVRAAALRDDQAWIGELYADHGQEQADRWAVPLSPRGRRLLATGLERFFATDAGRAWLDGASGSA